MLFSSVQFSPSHNTVTEDAVWGHNHNHQTTDCVVLSLGVAFMTHVSAPVYIWPVDATVLIEDFPLVGWTWSTFTRSKATRGTDRCREREGERERETAHNERAMTPGVGHAFITLVLRRALIQPVTHPVTASPESPIQTEEEPLLIVQLNDWGRQPMKAVITAVITRRFPTQKLSVHTGLRRWSVSSWENQVH